MYRILATTLAQHISSILLGSLYTRSDIVREGAVCQTNYMDVTGI